MDKDAQLPKLRFATRYEAHYGDRVFRCYTSRPRSVLGMLDAAIAKAADQEAVVSGNDRLSYQELGDAVDTVATNLAALGVQAGDRVALLLGNNPQFLISLFAALRLGAIAVPLNTREQREGLAYCLNNCTATVLIYDADLADKVPEARSTPALKHRFVVGDAEGGNSFKSLLAPPRTLLPDVDTNEEDTVVILYTSGTTGMPKGVQLTNLGIVHSTMHFEEAVQLQPGERTILAVPASHVTGLVAILLATIRVAGCNILMRTFDVDEFLGLAAREKVSYTVMVPAMYNLCLLRADLSAYDLSAWRVGGFGGAPMPESTIARFQEKLPELQLVNAYGATETTSPVTIMPPEFTETYPDSIGRLVTCADVRIMNDAGIEVPAGETGEMWISGPMVVPGYWNNPEETTKNFTAGYWRSGDIASIDAEGFVRIFDRMKDMIIRGGYNIYSTELENVLYECPGVAECAVIGRPDPVLGEKIHVIIHSMGADLDEARVREYCKERLADYKIPDFITFREESLPRNANGKIIKNLLRQQAAK